jgi:hypothetical protein
MTQKQIDMYRQLSHILMKMIFSAVLLICFVGVLIFIGYLIISKQSFLNIALVTVLETGVGYCMPQIIKHYFPTNEVI